ncbi:hypothetical protein IW139_001079 [Coemansia sp. RSA 353]|nr:hypothetical protein IW142_003742 [Coemansia sp. RSA 564]KAJ2197391.1 hypothetical protein IW144_002441 [Coemansia sp. RSA 522]KAJ2224364.1 Ring finger domain [Coemansia sp. RSA 520]KAJ2275814.1 hypothetical protein J3F81_001646 [Coemansia sp. RSA 371]KAJ2279496.1 hypothetical protein GGH14_002734 [Coemansia sp. RSA 370]KAJ2300442.1 hypothetical protein IW139_001079 [Coemansia sp. RSA 353]KAJ2536267.1 hypothetical protein IWW43_000994 [Coemansia sp. RSA 1935]KAJ2720702.1 hypothetical prot
MSCVICHESIFAAQQVEATGAQGPRTRAAALSCGHVFHKRCIDRWFDTSSQSVCPTCQSVHTGNALTLFIDYDETEAQRTAEEITSAEEAAEEDEAELRSLRASVRELTTKLSQTTEMARQTLQAVTNQQRVHNERLYELEEKNEEIDRLETELNESHGENEWLGSENARLERQAKGHLGNIRGLQRKVGEQRARIDELEDYNPEWLQSEVNRLEQLAVSHSANISGMNRKIRDQAARISDLEFDNNSEWLQSEVDRLEQLAVSHSSNISGMNRKIRDQAARINDLEFDNNEMSRLSEAHRSHIRSLQGALESHKDMLDEYGHYSSSESDSDSGYSYY